jgi:hypothetical protein
MPLGPDLAQKRIPDLLLVPQIRRRRKVAQCDYTEAAQSDGRHYQDHLLSRAR